MVFIKTVPKGGLGIEAANKRKCEELEQTKGDKGKDAQKTATGDQRHPDIPGMAPRARRRAGRTA
eukprot:16357212-Heterocapsa_arctica.AAC.1